MNRIPLSDYLQKNSQTTLAEAVGLTQGAISKMMRSGRKVIVIVKDSGDVELAEEKRLAGKSDAA
jgi:hypothetical protein